MAQSRVGVWLAAACAIELIGTIHPAAAQDSTQQELHDLRELVRQQAAAMQAMQRRLDQIEARQRGHAATSAPAPTASALPAELTITPPGRVPSRTDRNVVVTQQPGNLPGWTSVQPYTGAGMASPGSTPPVPAAPVASGGDKVRLSISGQVDRMLLFGSDGKTSNVRNVDNNNSSTRLRIVGEATITDTASGGVNIETELRPNPSSATPLTQNLPQPASVATFTVRQAEAYMQDTRYGGVRLGFGSSASYLTTQVDLSGTALVSFAQVSDFDGGFAFRQRGPARVPAAGGTFVASPDGAYGPAVGAVFNYFDGLSRDDRIRYDTPSWHGFGLATSFVDGGAFDIALRYAGTFNLNPAVEPPNTSQSGLCCNLELPWRVQFPTFEVFH
jgi:hypothetical protein